MSLKWASTGTENPRVSGSSLSSAAMRIRWAKLRCMAKHPPVRSAVAQNMYSVPIGRIEFGTFGVCAGRLPDHRRTGSYNRPEMWPSTGAESRLELLERLDDVFDRGVGISPDFTLPYYEHTPPCCQQVVLHS